MLLPCGKTKKYLRNNIKHDKINVVKLKYILLTEQMFCFNIFYCKLFNIFIIHTSQRIKFSINYIYIFFL